MILDSKKEVLDYKGDAIVGTMKSLALEAFEVSKIEDPLTSEIAGRAMAKIYNGLSLNKEEIAITKTVMMSVHHARVLDYISKEFSNAN